MNSPNFNAEKAIFKKGFRTVAGADEVGRGCFAGPVVAAAVAFPSDFEFRTKDTRLKLNDSKKMTAKQRERASYWIKRNASKYGIGVASVTQINKFGIKKASEIAFRKAIKNLGRRIDFLLIDAFYIPFVKGTGRKNQLPIINGDEKSYSIAAASIIAKVYRDKLMFRIGSRARYKKFKWAINKGYGTKEHQKAILKYGITGYHRKQFVETFLKNHNVRN